MKDKERIEKAREMLKFCEDIVVTPGNEALKEDIEGIQRGIERVLEKLETK
jgi:hypothetical protein